MMSSKITNNCCIECQETLPVIFRLLPVMFVITFVAVRPMSPSSPTYFWVCLTGGKRAKIAGFCRHTIFDASSAWSSFRRLSAQRRLARYRLGHGTARQQCRAKGIRSAAQSRCAHRQHYSHRRDAATSWKVGSSSITDCRSSTVVSTACTAMLQCAQPSKLAKHGMAMLADVAAGQHTNEAADRLGGRPPSCSTTAG